MISVIAPIFSEVEEDPEPVTSMNTIYSIPMQIYLCIFLVAEYVVADIITILAPMMLVFLQDKQAIYKFRHPEDKL